VAFFALYPIPQQTGDEQPWVFATLMDQILVDPLLTEDEWTLTPPISYGGVAEVNGYGYAQSG
jgi:hypothetical protein